MNASQIKIQIFVIRIADLLLVAALVVYLVYAYMHSYSSNFIMTIAIAGLVIVHQFGRWSISRVAYLQQTVKRLESVPHIR